MRSIENTCYEDNIYGDRESEITKLETIIQRSDTWSFDAGGEDLPLSAEDARDVYRTVSHFSIRTPHSRSYLRRMVETGLDMSKLGRDPQDAFERASTSLDLWDRTFSQASVRIVSCDSDLMTSAFPTSSFEEPMDLDGVAYRHHVTMALDRRKLAHVMVASFDLNARIQQKFWTTKAESKIVQLHNLNQVARFALFDEIEYLVCPSPKHNNLAADVLVSAGYRIDVDRPGKRVFVRSAVPTGLSR